MNHLLLFQCLFVLNLITFCIDSVLISIDFIFLCNLDAICVHYHGVLGDLDVILCSFLCSMASISMFGFSFNFRCILFPFILVKASQTTTGKCRRQLLIVR
jgi:hypothetical protein